MAAEKSRAVEVAEDVSLAMERLAQVIPVLSEPVRRFGQALRCLYWLVVVPMMVLEAERYARLSLPRATRNADESP